MLAIVGSGEYLAPMEAVDRELLALAPPQARVVCLPTAAGREGDDMIDDWMQRGVDHFDALGAEAEGVRVWDRESADDPMWAAKVASADIVYLSGGNPSYLHATMESSAVWRAIVDVTNRGGLLIGCSAGAMIQGDVFVARRGRQAGFGLWPGVNVVPHFDQIPSAAVAVMRRAAGTKHTVVGVNGNTALLNVDGAYRVIGDEVTVWNATGKETFGEGEVPAAAVAE